MSNIDNLSHALGIDLSHEFTLPINYNSLSNENKRLVRLQYIEEQENMCHFCKCSLSLDPPHGIMNKKINWLLFPKNFLKYPIHLQHNHDTGMTEGAVHAYCNAVLWQYHGQ